MRHWRRAGGPHPSSVSDVGERLANLVALLLHTTVGKTREEIARHFEAYAREGEAGRQRFMQDLKTLRDRGVPVLQEQGRYRIRPEDFYLNLDLTDDERVALQLALAAVPVAGDAAEEVRARLAPGGGRLTDPVFHVELTDDERLPALLDAANRRCRVELRYGGTDRTVEPYGVLFRDRAWYLHARDVADGTAKNLRVDRIQGEVELGPPGAFQPPPVDLTAELPRQVWALPGDEPVEAVVAVDPVLAGKAVAEAGPAATVEWGDDGSVVLRFTVTHRAAFRSWLFGYLDRAELLGPPVLREEIAAWLEAVATAGDGVCGDGA